MIYLNWQINNVIFNIVRNRKKCITMPLSISNRTEVSDFKSLISDLKLITQPHDLKKLDVSMLDASKTYTMLRITTNQTSGKLVPNLIIVFGSPIHLKNSVFFKKPDTGAIAMIFGPSNGSRPEWMNIVENNKSADIAIMLLAFKRFPFEHERLFTFYDMLASHSDEWVVFTKELTTQIHNRTFFAMYDIEDMLTMHAPLLNARVTEQQQPKNIKKANTSYLLFYVYLLTQSQQTAISIQTL